MPDEPGLPADGEANAELLLRLVKALECGREDGTAGIKALLRQIEEESPGQIEAMAARLQLHFLKRTTAH